MKEIEKEEAVHEHINNADSAPTLFETERPSKKLPKPFGSIIEQAAETFDDLRQHGVVNIEGLKPTTLIELMEARPLPLETTPKAPFKIRRSFVFLYSNARAENVVVFKHR